MMLSETRVGRARLGSLSFLQVKKLAFEAMHSASHLPALPTLRRFRRGRPDRGRRSLR